MNLGPHSLRLRTLLFQQSRWRVIAGLVLSLFGYASFSWVFRYWARPRRQKKRDVLSTDPGLMVKGTSFQSYQTVSGFVYSNIRTFYHAHPQRNKLPDDLPLLVFMHGLGGSAAQFAPLLTSLVNIAPSLAIDLPGCGRSGFNPTDDFAYTTLAFAELLFAAIDRHRSRSPQQKVVLIGHSMGCSISALLASSNSPIAHLCSEHIIGMVAICPRSMTLSKQDLSRIERLNYIWSPIFDLLRLADRRGGVDSASVLRVVGKNADYETRKLQLRFNQQSRSDVFQRILKGILLQEKKTSEKGEESLLGRKIWSGVKKPLYLVAAQADKLAPPKEAEQIAEWLQREIGSELSESNDNKTTSSRHAEFKEVSFGSSSITPRKSSELPRQQTYAEEVAPKEQISAQPKGVESLSALATIDDIEPAGRHITEPQTTNSFSSEKEGRASSDIIAENETSTKHAHALKITVFPKPSAHGLLYATKDVRILSSLIESFLAKHVDKRLSPGWQLAHLTTSGKWDVKNLKKWQSIDPCSDPIGGIFRAMKTMREVDEVHTPREFVKHYSWKSIADGVAMIVDISHDVPVYNKNSLEAGDVEYHKFPTVSKQPPTEDEVEQFNGLVDTLRQSPKIANREPGTPGPTIGVHCHYGFNRTGFFITSYLIMKEHWKLEDALAEFASKRPPGIKHSYFVDAMYARYAAKIERRGTIVG